MVTTVGLVWGAAHGMPPSDTWSANSRSAANPATEEPAEKHAGPPAGGPDDRPPVRPPEHRDELTAVVQHRAARIAVPGGAAHHQRVMRAGSAGAPVALDLAGLAPVLAVPAEATPADDGPGQRIGRRDRRGLDRQPADPQGREVVDSIDREERGARAALAAGTDSDRAVTSVEDVRARQDETTLCVPLDERA